MKGTQIPDAGFLDAESGCREPRDGNSHAGRTAGAAAAKGVKSAADEELVLRLKRGRDEEAFNEMVDRYADVVFMVALGITLDVHDAGDVLQEAFLSIETPDTFRRGMKFTTWFYRLVMVLSIARTEAGKKRERNEGPDEYPPLREHVALKRICNGYPGAGFSDAAITEEWHGKIRHALGELPAGYRAVFQLADVEGLGNSEVAEILGLSAEGVRSRIRRVRLFLAERLSGHFYRPGGARRAEAG